MHGKGLIFLKIHRKCIENASGMHSRSAEPAAMSVSQGKENDSKHIEFIFR